MPKKLYLNGIDASTGGPLDGDLPIDTTIIAKVARGQRITKEDLRDARIKNSPAGKMADYNPKEGSELPPELGVAEGIDNTKLAETGWGVIFPAGLPQPSVDAIKDALKPLLELRKQQASAADPNFYKEFIGPDGGYKNGESKNDFLKRFGRGVGPAEPASGVPYYLLIVGSPETIPYTFQYQLDVQYGVGRIYFENLEDYSRYANSVVQAETRKFARAKKAAFFGVANPDDRATAMSAKKLIRPLAMKMKTRYKDWAVDIVAPTDATKANLANYMGGKDTPALLFTASHGMGFKPDDSRQPDHQGALLCQDWPGPRVRIPIDDKLYFSADDISADADVFGMFAFVFACYGGGTPKVDNFYRQAFGTQKDIAPQAFMARLPLKLLAHPKGGALGVFAHVERAWGSSIVWDGAVDDIGTFNSTVRALLDGKPAGAATEFFNERYAEISTMLTEELDNTSEGHEDDIKLAGMWTSNNDARNYAFIGDPAVRLAVGDKATTKAVRANLGAVVTKAPVPAVIGAFQPDIVERAPAAQVAAPVAPAANYGIFKKDDKKAEAAPTGGGSEPPRKFADKLNEYLAKALDDATSLEVFTYVAENMQDVTYKSGKFGGGAQLRAMTRVDIGGDTLVCVPEKDGEVDTAVWNIHLEMVKQAQASRAELLKTLVSAATGIVNLVK
jgi:hypothetical protein